MDAQHEPGIVEVVVMKSAQVGWTEILNNTIGYHIHRAAAPTMLMQPTLDMAEAWSKDRFAPMVRDTPCITERIADPKSRDSGNTLLHKRFAGGHLTIVGANSPASLASRPIRILLCDEVDRYPMSAGTEGDPIDLARKRTTTFRNRKVMLGSTPTVKGSSRIEAAFEQSDQRYYYVPCTHCGEFQRLVWSQVRWTDGQPETASYVCQHCGSLLTDADKPEMLRRGEWRPTKETNGIAGFHISELYSPWTSWPEMAASFLRAKRLPETLKTWINTALGETWEEDGSTIEPGSLLERRESYGPEQIPAGVLMLTIGADVQNDRVELQLQGWGAGEENWVIEQHVLRGDPDRGELWREVDEYLLRQYVTEDGRKLQAEAVAIDSGGLSTQAVYQFVVTRKRRRVWAIKGMAGTGRLAWPKRASKTPKSRAMVFIVGVDTIKSTLYGRLAKVQEPGPGYIHLPASADDGFCTQMTSERAVTKYVRGRPTVVWEPRAKDIAQEAQDCWVYGYAAMLGRGGAQVLAARSRRPVSTASHVAEEQPQIMEPAKSIEATVPAPVVQQVVRPQQPGTFRRKGWFR